MKDASVPSIGLAAGGRMVRTSSPSSQISVLTGSAANAGAEIV
jgi:hypothetical protein